MQALIDKSTPNKDTTDLAALKSLVDKVLTDTTPIAETRQTLQYLSTRFVLIKSQPCIELCTHVINRLQARGSIFPREEGIFKRELAVCLESAGDSDTAIRLLSSI